MSMIYVRAFFVVLLLAIPVSAQTNDTQQSDGAEHPVVPQPPPSGLATWESAARGYLNGMISAIPAIPAELGVSTARLRNESESDPRPPVLVVVALIAILGILAERIMRTYNLVASHGLAAVMPTLALSATVAIAFFSVNWPPLNRIVALNYLLAFLCYRFGSVAIEAFVDRKFRRRVRVMLSVFVFAVATVSAGEALALRSDVLDSIALIFSACLLVLAVEMVANASHRRLLKLAVISSLIFAWVAWILNFKVLFWLVLYVAMVPALVGVVSKFTARHFSHPKGWLSPTVAKTAARTLVLIGAIGWLTWVWVKTPDAPGHDSPVISAIFLGLMKSAVIILLAELFWQTAKEWISSGLVAAQPATHLPSDVANRQARLRTLLPIFRNALGVLVLTLTVLLVLASLGVEIGPLIAGAGIFGVAIGFGSQALVKDVISGVFYMMDDAFRVGEYIQAKNYKGTVEGFSLRSVRLRHHRGPVYTVPFGELGAIQNMSRDWGVVKFRISVDFDTDLEKVRKLTKRIGSELQADPDFGSLFIEPLKMKGLEEFTEYGMVLSFGMTLRPSPMQSFIRRKANVRIREAFLENQIQFARPSVQVQGARGKEEVEDISGAATITRPRQTQPEV